MIEIAPALFIGCAADYEEQVSGEAGWVVVHACREPYHRRLLGYTGRGAPPEHPEYLYALRGDRLYLNLVDAHRADYIPVEVVNTGLMYANQQISAGNKVLIHCNKGESRAAVMGLLYLMVYEQYFTGDTIERACGMYAGIYPPFAPLAGMFDWLKIHWQQYQYIARLNAAHKTRILPAV